VIAAWCPKLREKQTIFARGSAAASRRRIAPVPSALPSSMKISS